MLATDLPVWPQVLAFAGHPPRRWEPKRLRMRLLAVAGRTICSGWRRFLRLPRAWHWSELIESGWTAIQTARPATQATTTEDRGPRTEDQQNRRNMLRVSTVSLQVLLLLINVFGEI